MSQFELIPLPHDPDYPLPGRPRWECPECGSRNVQIALPAWHRETDITLTYVETDEGAEVMWWLCDDCHTTGQGAPIDRYPGEFA